MRWVLCLSVLGIPVGIQGGDGQDPELASPGEKVLPELFVSVDGERIVEPTSWSERRLELREILEFVEYGRMPPRPDRIVISGHRSLFRPDLDGREERLTLLIGSQTRIPMRIAVYTPDRPGPHAFLIREEHALGHEEEIPSILSRGYAFVEFAREDLDPDEADVVGPAQAAYPDHDWATLAVWAWGAMRVVDYLESRSDVVEAQIGIAGHSRGGKMALLAGAFDPRFSLVIANGSGAGGAGSFKVAGDQAETLELITRPDRFGYWFHPRLRTYAGRESQLPFDQHFLKALVAPRALLCTEALEDRWANPLGNYQTHVAAREVFEFLGVGERIGLHFREGGHAFTNDDWEAALDFADGHWRGLRPDDPKRFWQRSALED